ncbi:MAG: MFS transporter [Pseudomonadota bacterium]
MLKTARASRREILGWAMFDFANQAYTLLIITVIFGDLFTRVIVGDAGNDYRLGNLLWSLSLATSYLLVVIAAPTFGAVMDGTGRKKQFLFVSYLLTVVSTAALWFVAPGYVGLGVLLIIVSNYAYSMGESFIAAFLPELARPEEMGRVSGFGWALGYIGGMVATAFTLVMLGEVSESNFDRIRWVGPFAAVFFLLCAIPTFLWMRERAPVRPLPLGTNWLRLGMERLRASWNGVRHFPDMTRFLVSLFFSMAGIYIIISYAFIYGSQVIGWDESTRVLMFVAVQISAAVGALAFGLIQDGLGAKRTYLTTLGIWIAAILLIRWTEALTGGLNRLLGTDWEAQFVFVAVGVVAGVALGSCQSAGRTVVGLFSPRGRAAELFGFWGVSLRLAGAFGLLAVGLLQYLVGLENAMLFCAALFAVAGVVALGVGESRGRRRARAADRLEERREGAIR